MIIYSYVCLERSKTRYTYISKRVNYNFSIQEKPCEFASDVDKKNGFLRFSTTLKKYTKRF